MSSRLFKQGGTLALVTLGAVFIGSMAYGVKEEVPVGTLAGRVVMKENNKPLPNADVVFTPQFELPDDAKIPSSTETDKDGRFSMSGMPAGIYYVNVYGKVHEVYGESIYVPEGGLSDKSLSAELSGSRFDLSISDRVFLPSEGLTATVSGATDDNHLDLEIYQVDYKRLEHGDSVYTYANSLMRQKSPKDPTKVATQKPVRTMTHDLKSRDVEGYFTESLKVDPLPEGMYLIRAKSKDDERMAYFTVSKIAMISKTIDSKGLAYVVDLASGKPIKGVQIAVHSPSANTPVGATDGNGVLSFAVPGGSGEVSASATYGGSRAFTWFYSYQADGDNAQIWMQTDRPVYRPGDQVEFRGVIRTAKEGKLSTPVTGNVHVKVYDPDEIVISDKTVPVSRFGTFNGDFASDAVAPPGGYRIEAEYGSSKDSRTVQVLTYRKPEFSIDVTAERKAYRRGEPIRWKVKVEYFTGEPVAGAEVDATLFRGANWWGNPFDEDFDSEQYGETGYYDEYLGDHKATTNASGEATIETPSGTFESEYADFSDYEYSLDVTVSDQSGRGFTANGKVAVTRGSVDIKAEFDSWIADPSQPQTASVDVTAYETEKGVPGAKLSYEYVRNRWTEHDMVEVPVDKGTATADANGHATINVTPDKEGSYTLKVWLMEGNNKVATESWQWVGGDGESGPAPDMQVVLDKAKYGAKDTAKALIRTSKPGGYALVSIESDALKRVQVIQLKDTATTVTLGKLAEFAPGAEVSVAYVKDKSFMSAGATLRVEYSAQKINVDVKADRDEAKPGENVTYTISATDNQGRPLQAEVAMGVVDEGIYQILEDSNDPLRAFYSYDWNQVNTNYSFPTLYLDGEDKAEPNVQIRKVFKDTAFWTPSVVTGANGQAKVTVKMPDNLTSWRATATAVTADSKFGKSKTSVIVKKDLMARLSAPSFMVQGDTQEIGGLITNTTDTEQTVDVKLIGAGLQVNGDATHRMTIPARGAVTATWMLAAGDPTTAKLELTAIAGSGLNDGLQQSFPIKPFGRRMVTGKAGAKTGGESFAVDLDPKAVSGTLDIKVEPSLASTIVTSVEQLVDYPYGCTEQTMSKFMPAIATQGLLERLGAMPDSIRAKLPQVTKESLRRLRRFQSDDGGWGWWEYDEADQRMTAVVLEGLYEARAAGVDVDPTMIDRGLKWAREALAKVPDTITATTTLDDYQYSYEVEQVSQLAYAASLYGPDPAVTKVNRLLMANRVVKLMSPASLARTALAWKKIAEASEGASRTEAEAYGKQAYAALLAYAKDGDIYEDVWWGEDNPRALQAMAEYETDPNRVAAFAMQLLPHRQNGEWSSTREAAIYVLAIKRYLEKANVTTLDGQITVKVNGTVVASGTYNAQNQAQLSVKLPMDKLQKGSNQIEIASTAGTAPVYLARLDQVVGMDEIPQADAKTLRINREYMRMEAKQMEDGTLRLEPRGGSVGDPKSGEVLRCRITIKADQAYEYVMVEDPIPSGFRIVEADEPFSSYGEWTWWWDATSFYDDRAVFFKAHLPKGDSVFEYAVRAEAPGRSRALPTFVSPMYQPEIMASSSSIAVEVKK
jgi:uncharacterized protein YfaS (alpha-2-macroglobulin family)